MKYNIDAGRGKLIEVPDYLRHKIIKDYLMIRYHWTIGISMFIIGLFLGILIK
jgi:hypothetical protein